VLFNGEAVKSCTLLAPMLDGGTLTTIEGRRGRAVRMRCIRCSKRFIKITACNAALHPGMVMTAVALATKNPTPTEAEVRHGLEAYLPLHRLSEHRGVRAGRSYRHACTGIGE